jgi:transcriptional regulator GlxA family with amidase domain
VTCGLNVLTVSPDGAHVRAHTGLSITPGYSIADCPKPDVLVIPGGDPGVVEKDSSLGAWIRNTASGCRIVLSVCTGAFILAKLGLLDGLRATTWHGALKGLAKAAPACEVLSGVRWTDNERVITTAGISAGIDGSLHAVSKLCGSAAAEKTAGYMDYEYWTGAPDTGK